MVDVTNTAEPNVDIWPYVQQLKNDKLVLDYVFERQLVEKVFRNDNNTFDQVLLPTSDANVFVVIIVDLINSKVKGHFKLDLTEEYGIKKS